MTSRRKQNAERTATLVRPNKNIELLATVADAEGATQYGKKLGQHVKTLGAKMKASGAKVDKLAECPKKQKGSTPQSKMLRRGLMPSRGSTST